MQLHSYTYSYSITPGPVPQSHSQTHIQVPGTPASTYALTSRYHSGAQPAPVTPIQAHASQGRSQSHTYSRLFPPPSSQGWSKSRTKAQRPLLPFPLNSPLPTRLASSPFVLLQLSLSPGRVAGTLSPGCWSTGSSTDRSGQQGSSSCRVPGRGHGQVRAK